MYVVYDDYGNTYNKMDYKGLRKFLVNEIIRDGVNRLDEDNNTDRIKECLDELRFLALDANTTEIKYIKDELFKYGWYVQDLQDLHCRVSGFLDYLRSKGVPNVDIGIGHVELTLGLIEGEMKYDKRV